jgi:MerR family redox-sensitive transcriptional activator SoxR
VRALTIGELSRRTGVRSSALRYYEEAGILPKPARVSGQRRYGPEAVNRVNVLRFAQQAGFSLEDIRALFGTFASGATMGARWRSLAVAKLRELDLLTRRIASMRRAIELGMKCGCVRIEDCDLTPADADDQSSMPRTRGCSPSC